MASSWSTTKDDDLLSKSTNGGEDRSTIEDGEPASRSTNDGEQVSTTEGVDWASWSSDGDEGVHEGTWGDCNPERACIHPTPLMCCMSTLCGLSVQDMTQVLQLEKVAKSMKSKVQNEPRTTLRQGFSVDALLHSRW